MWYTQFICANQDGSHWQTWGLHHHEDQSCPHWYILWNAKFPQWLNCLGPHTWNYGAIWTSWIRCPQWLHCLGRQWNGKVLYMHLTMVLFGVLANLQEACEGYTWLWLKSITVVWHVDEFKVSNVNLKKDWELSELDKRDLWMNIGLQGMIQYEARLQNSSSGYNWASAEEGQYCHESEVRHCSAISIISLTWLCNLWLEHL